MLRILFFLFSVVIISSDVLAENPRVINQLPGNVYLPVGFDDNDNTQLVIDGFFPNSCYRLAQYNVDVNSEQKKVTIYNQVYYYSGSPCLMVLVPYSRVINVGILSEGTYEVQFVNDKAQPVSKATLVVDKSSNPGPDDFFYAPVEDAYAELKSNGVHELVIRGEYTNTCMMMDRIKVHNIQNNVLVVQPILKLKDFSKPECAQVMIPYEERVVLSERPNDKILIHVRSLNGKALNKIFKF